MGYNRTDDANIINKRYMDSILFEERLVGSVAADTETEFLGERFSMPIFMPAFSHLNNFGGRSLTGLEEYSLAAKELNVLNFVGMVENDMFEKIVATGAKTVRIVKPYADNGKVRDQMQFAEFNGAFGIGMDIDHIFGMNGYDICMGEKMTAQSADMLRSYVEASKLPFIVKGVLSVRDALLCADIGVKAIIVSHHHGRLPYAVPPMMILPEIKEALKGRDVRIIVDCGIASGSDVYKAIALGADAAAVGRGMLPYLEKDGTEGVKSCFGHIRDELRYVMSFTGFSKVSDIDDSALRFTR
ncbi:alpha-hydroxy-acid oxidizing protein [Ruminococcus albus]|uniref:FMN-dependent dehydrogenase, includes L-lactate dehydrogenase and type II isopentenyl diphosphate isomerase n=1 Tax=Ruminococcus albus TaxID=1264 RepID=A0A1H7F3N7_RUMAL|nr:alpha-hydroxy-acid oxidizing protein [Ruminococcus albus]SEK20766.1 FMN-dependent dehydrogenase, includes L-lactate dehydrogenase and type II isopentenyl diphosphate isomerase [Ruminococcus albus]